MRHTTLFSILAFVPIGAFAQAGSLDPDFGTGGKVLVPLLGAGQDDQAVTAVVLPDDKILVAGRSSDGTHYNSVLLRFNADGSPDMTFGTSGVVQHDLAAGSEFIRSCAIDAQGRLVVGGHLFSDAAETNSDMFAARFLADGSLDPTFNGTGLLIRDIHGTPDAEEAYDVLLQPDGKIVLCGFTGTDPEFTEIVVERYLDNGGLDPSFGGDGSVLVGIVDATGEQVRGAALGADGGIYFCGFGIKTGETVESLLLGHVDTNGNWPSTFGNANGHSWVSSTDNDMVGRTIAIAPSGEIVVAGVRRNTGLTQARIIQSFSALGIEWYDSYEDNTDGGDAWNSLLVQNNGAVLSGGNWADGPGSRNWSVERCAPTLSPDGSFSAADYDEDGGEETCFDLKFTGDSSVLAIGTAQVAGLMHIALLKYQNDINTGVDEAAIDEEISAFPNPTEARAVIMMDTAVNGSMSLEVADAQGRLVQDWSSRAIGSGRLELDLAALSPGLYSVRMKSAERNASIRIVKQ